MTHVSERNSAGNNGAEGADRQLWTAGSGRGATRKRSVTYADAGVSIDAGDRAVELLKSKVKKTTRPEVIGDLGGFSGQNEVPRVAGQHYEYTLKQLLDFKTKARTNDAGNMTAVVRTISDDDLKAVAAYAASLQ